MHATDGGSGDWRQWRRLQALRLKQHGWYQRDIAGALMVSEVSVSHWLSRARMGGARALLAHPPPGPASALSADELRLIPEFLWHGPEAYGFCGKVWTCARIARVIEEELGVAYDKGHVSRLLRKLRWTPQMPIRRAIQRDEKAIEYWRQEVWPRLFQEAKSERRTLVFVDEAGFYLLPSVVRTYAPCAQTPVLRWKLTSDHLSVMGGMTPSGKVYTLARQESLNGLHSIQFLTHLLHVAGRRLLVIWDGSPIHRRRMVKEFIEDLGQALRVENLPAYAPDLNPWDEGGWNHLKNVEMRNLPCRDVEELHEEFHLAVGRLRQKPYLTGSFFKQAGLGTEKV
jgi:transposase